MPQRQGWARTADHIHASFPAMDKIPESAREAVDNFLNLRVRLSDAGDVVRETHLAMAAAVKEENQALKQHVQHGGVTDTFERTAARDGQQAIDNASQDYKVLKELIGPAYLKAMHALEDAAPAGIATADQDVKAAAPAYLAAIDAVEQARRDYLRALGLRYFWAYLTEQHQAAAGAGQMDVIVLDGGPITRVDEGAFSLLRSDAKAHTRLDGTSAAASTW